MADNESIEIYIHRVNDIEKAIQVVGGLLEESYVIKKISFTLTKPYKSKK